MYFQRQAKTKAKVFFMNVQHLTIGFITAILITYQVIYLMTLNFQDLFDVGIDIELMPIKPRIGQFDSSVFYEVQYIVPIHTLLQITPYQDWKKNMFRSYFNMQKYDKIKSKLKKTQFPQFLKDLPDLGCKIFYIALSQFNS